MNNHMLRAYNLLKEAKPKETLPPHLIKAWYEYRDLWIKEYKEQKAWIDEFSKHTKEK